MSKVFNPFTRKLDFTGASLVPNALITGGDPFSIPYLNASSEIQFSRNDLQWENGIFHFNKLFDLSTIVGSVDLFKYGNINYDWTLSFNDVGETIFNTTIRTTQAAYADSGFYGALFYQTTTGTNTLFGALDILSAAIATTSTNMLHLWNTNVSTSGIPNQWSPALDYVGNSWTGSANRIVRFRQELRTTNAATPIGTLNFGSSVDTGPPSFTTRMSLNSNGKLTLPITGSAAGILLGGDVDVFRGATNRLDFGSDDSLHIPNGASGLGVGTTPSSSRTVNVLRTSAAAVGNENVAQFNFNVNHGITGFPSALGMFVAINSGSNTVGFMAGLGAQVSIQNGTTGVANNIYATDISTRWNTNSATATSNIVIGGNFYTTADNANSSGTVANFYGAQFNGGMPVETTALTVTGSIIGGRFLVNVPTVGASGAIATNLDLINHSVGASGSAILFASMVRIAPLTANYTSGTKYPVLFNGTSSNLNEIGIWWGTDGNNVALGRVANNTLGMASGDSFQITAGNLITDTVTGMQIATATAQRLGMWGATPVVRPSLANDFAYTITNDTTSRTIDVSTITLTQLANFVATVAKDSQDFKNKLKTVGIIA